MPVEMVFDIVDLLQLQEVWARRPIIAAFARLEQRLALLPATVEFSVEALVPRLARLKNSAVWKANPKDRDQDPGQMPMCRLSEIHLQVLYPEADQPARSRQILFNAVYNLFVFAQYRGDAAQTRGMLRALAQVRQIDVDRCLNTHSLPLMGGEEWVPSDLTDEIRALDGRYEADQPGTPATYVVADDFWALLVKASPEDVEQAAARYCNGRADEQAAVCNQQLNTLVEVARAWNRSPSVVGLCYQVDARADD